MSKHLILFGLFMILAIAQTQANDQVDCFRMKDSSFAHFASCSATKPLPLKVETTFTLDKDFTWGLFSYDVALYDGVQKKTSSLSKCIQGNSTIQAQGTPGVGNKTAGMNLTLATTCNTLPRELRQYDMIRYEVHFPNTEWLIWAVPIPGYTTEEDVKKIMEQQEFNTPQIRVNENIVDTRIYSSIPIEVVQHSKKLTNIRAQKSY